MRIVQLISQTVIGGAENFAFLLSAELTRRGHDVVLLANRRNGRLFDQEHPAGLRLLALDRKSRRDPRIVSFIGGAIRRFRPDILHSHNFGPNTWSRTLSCFFPRLEVVCHEHSSDKERQTIDRLWLDRILFRRCSAVLAVHEELAELLCRRYRIPKKRVHTVLNGVDVTRFMPPTGISRDPRSVICVANMSSPKNHSGLLSAWRRVHEAVPEAILTLVGDGPLRAELEAQTARDGLNPSVEFVGAVTDVRPYLQRASIFVMPSHHEAMPLSLLEATASGLPCVATSVGSIPLILDGGEAGMLVPPRDPGALALSLQFLLTHAEDRERMGRRGRKVAVERFSFGTCVSRIEAIYEELLR